MTCHRHARDHFKKLEQFRDVGLFVFERREGQSGELLRMLNVTLAIERFYICRPVSGRPHSKTLVKIYILKEQYQVIWHPKHWSHEYQMQALRIAAEVWKCVSLARRPARLQWCHKRDQITLASVQ